MIEHRRAASRRWADTQRRRGRCRTCGAHRGNDNALYCDRHREAARAAQAIIRARREYCI